MVGGGQVLFRDGQKQALRLAGTRTFGTGVVVLTYHPCRPAAGLYDVDAAFMSFYVHDRVIHAL